MEELEKFLRKHRCWTSFRLGFMNQHTSSNMKEYVDNRFKYGIESTLIIASIDWENTKGGYKFWDKINSKWRQHLRKNKS